MSFRRPFRSGYLTKLSKNIIQNHTHFSESWLQVIGGLGLADFALGVAQASRQQLRSWLLLRRHGRGRPQNPAPGGPEAENLSCSSKGIVEAFSSGLAALMGTSLAIPLRVFVKAPKFEVRNSLHHMSRSFCSRPQDVLDSRRRAGKMQPALKGPELQVHHRTDCWLAEGAQPPPPPSPRRRVWGCTQ